MTPITRSLAFAFAALLALRLEAAAPNCQLKDERVERAIASVAAEVQGNEYCQFRHYLSLADIDSDGKDDFLVTFNVEGTGEGTGNDVVCYLMAFITSRTGKAPLRLEIGARGTRLPNAIWFDGRNVLIGFVRWLDSDARCCPSGTEKRRYVITRDTIVEKRDE
jgi:hypothetical protein